MKAILCLLMLATAGCAVTKPVHAPITDSEAFAEMVRVYGQVEAAQMWEEFDH